MIPIDIHGDVDILSSIIAIFALIFMFLIFIFGGYLILNLWKIVIGAFKESNEGKARILLDLVGGLTISGKFKIVGVGLCGTILILLFCIFAMKELSVTITSNPSPKIKSQPSTHGNGANKIESNLKRESIETSPPKPTENKAKIP